MTDYNTLDTIVDAYLDTNPTTISLKGLFANQQTEIFTKCEIIDYASVWKDRLNERVKAKGLDTNTIVKDSPDWVKVRSDLKRVQRNKNKKGKAVPRDTPTTAKSSSSRATAAISSPRPLVNLNTLSPSSAKTTPSSSGPLSNINTASTQSSSSAGKRRREEESDDERPKRKTMVVFREVEGEIEREGQVDDITKTLDKYRKRALFLRENNQILSNARFLSLVHIYAFSADMDRSVSKYFGRKGHQDFMANLLQNFKEPIDATYINKWVNSVSALPPTIDWLGSFQAIIDIVKDVTTTQLKYNIIAAAYLTRIVPTLTTRKNNSKCEDTLVETFIESLLKPAFQSLDGLVCDWANCKLSGFQDEDSIYKPDFLLSAKPWAKKYNLVAIEVKHPSATTKGDIVDFSKLGIEMKVMLDYIVKNNPEIIDPTVFGVLFEGLLCKLYKLIIDGKGKYFYIELGCFNIITMMSELGTIPAIMSDMFGLRKLVEEMANRLEAAVLEKANAVDDVELDGEDNEEGREEQQTTTSELLSWIRPDCDYRLVKVDK